MPFFPLIVWISLFPLSMKGGTRPQRKGYYRNRKDNLRSPALPAHWASTDRRRWLARNKIAGLFLTPSQHTTPTTRRLRGLSIYDANPWRRKKPGAWNLKPCFLAGWLAGSVNRNSLTYLVDRKLRQKRTAFFRWLFNRVWQLLLLLHKNTSWHCESSHFFVVCWYTGERKRAVIYCTVRMVPPVRGYESTLRRAATTHKKGISSKYHYTGVAGDSCATNLPLNTEEPSFHAAPSHPRAFDALSHTNA